MSGLWSRKVGAVGAVAASMALVAGLLPAAGAAEPAGPAERVRYGVVEGPPEIPADGDEVGTTTPTLVVDGVVDSSEIVVFDTDGAAVAGSGYLDGDRWVVTDGALVPGGSYQWSAAAPTGGTVGGTSFPVVDQDLQVTGDMIIGSRLIEHAPVQDTRTFSVSTGIGPAGAPHGLRTDFFPHYDIESEIPLDDDGEPVDELPPSVLPGPGSETVSETGRWNLVEGTSAMCPKEERAPKPPPGQFPPPPIVYSTTEWILCDVRYGVSAEATVTDAGGHAAAHNVAGHNVAPSFSTTITSDVAITDGFVVSTAGDHRISSAFPLQTEFGFRSLGHIQVPESGAYRFGTQSPGGAQLAIYDTTDTDLGETLLSDGDAWWPTTIDEDYQASTPEWTFRNRETHTTSSQDGAYFYRTRHYEHAADAVDWFQADDRSVRGLLDDLRDSGPRADDVRWGETVQLEAGRMYPIAFTGWLGPIGGDIGIHVDGPGSGPAPVPFEWLTAAPAGTVGFDRGPDISAVADIDGVAFAVNGHGDTLAVLGADGSLSFHHTDGGVGWKHVHTVPGLGFPQPQSWEVAAAGPSMSFDDAGTTLAVALDRWPDADRQPGEVTIRDYDAVMGLEDMLALVRDGSDHPTFVFTGHRAELREPIAIDLFLLADSPWRDVTLQFEELSFHVEPGGSLQAGTVRGVLDDPDRDRSWPLDSVRGTLDHGSGALYLEFDSELDGETRLFALTLEEANVEPGPPVELPSPLEVALVDRIDPNGPWSEANTRITSVNDLLDAAGIEPPSVIHGGLGPSTWPYSFTTHGSHAMPGFTVTDDAVSLKSSFGRNLGGLSDPLWGYTAWRVSLSLSQLDLDHDGYNITGGTVTGNYLVDLGPPGARFTYAFDEVVGGTVHPVTGVISVDVAVRASGSYQGDTTLEFTPEIVVSDVPQAVSTSPDGDTVTVLQPTGGSQRVVVVDRDHSGAAWSVLGTFPLALERSDAPVAVGRDGDQRFLATAEDDVVTVRAWTPAGGWQVTAELPVGGPVASLSLDFYAEHLAVGQPDIGRVTVYERSWWGSDWTHQVDLDGPDAFGSSVGYGFGLLAVGDTDSSLVKVYRDTGFQPWSSYSDWVRVEVAGDGAEILASTGGTPIRFRLAAAAVDLGDAFDGLPTHIA